MTNEISNLYDEDNFNHDLYYAIDYSTLVPKTARSLIKSYKHAVDENLNTGKYFLVDLDRFSEDLQLDKQVINCILYYMEESDLAYYQSSGIKNTKLVEITNKLFQFLPECEQKDDTHYLWDKELESIHNQKWQIETFQGATNELRLFIKKCLKNPEIVPLSAYAYCNAQFIFYDIPPIFLADENLKEKIYKCIKAKNFKLTDLIKFIDEQCEEMQYWDTSNLL